VKKPKYIRAHITNTWKDRDVRADMNKHISHQRILAAGLATVVAGVAVVGVKFALDKPDRPHVAQSSKSESPASTSVARSAPRSDLAPLLAAAAEKDPQIAPLYERFGYAPLWVGSRHLKNAALMSTAAQAQGIDTTVLAHLLLSANNRDMDAGEIARVDTGLTREALRLATALRLGVVPTEKIGSYWVMQTDTYDAAAGLGDALDKNTFKSFIAELQPNDPQYKALTTALQAYRDIVEQGGWPQIPGTDEVLFEEPGPRADALRARLAAENYVPRTGIVDAGALREAIIEFQNRNGLEPDGRIGKGTLAALNVSAADRLGQIAANLERWRHTPHDRGEKFIAVNTAATHLDYMMSGESVLRLKVVAGAKRHATPVLSVKMTGVTLNPRWEIPASIARKEILPKLQKDPNYLASHNMVIADGGVEGDPHGQYVDWSQYSSSNFPLRLRQRPGDDNSLGLMKFQMSNPQNIYLHDTPSRSFFAKYERHLSHGCIRVDQPSTLAEHVLLETEGWDKEKIDAEIATGITRTIALKEPLPVWISYWTVFSEDGQLNFRNDIYNRDAPLAQALGVVSGGTRDATPSATVASN
jgi:murein L,D-transpeptidase YcbB/YkuD